jgi:hypothetical protein
MQIKHCCADCGEVLAVHEHLSWQEIKDCQAGMRALCDSCRSWPGCPGSTKESRHQASHWAASCFIEKPTLLNGWNDSTSSRTPRHRNENEDDRASG